MSNTEHMITFGSAGDKPIVTKIVVFGEGAEVSKVQDLRSITEPKPEPVNIEGQVRAEEIFSGIQIKNIGQQKVGDSLSLATPYFSQPFIGQDTLHNISIAFSFDKDQFAESNMVFPSLSRISPAIWRLMEPAKPVTDPAPIVSMRVIKRRVKKDKRQNGRFVRQGYEVDHSSKTIIAELPGTEEARNEHIKPGRINHISYRHQLMRSKPINLFTALDVRNRWRRDFRRYIHSDEAKGILTQPPKYADYAGAYQYGVEITMLDKTPQAIKTIIEILQTNVLMLRQTIDAITSPSPPEDDTRYNSQNHTVNKPIGEIVLGQAAVQVRLEKIKRVMQGVFIIFSSQVNRDWRAFESRVDSTIAGRNLIALERHAEFLEGYLTKIMEKAKKAMPTLELSGIARANNGSSPGKKNMPVVVYETYFDEIVDINTEASSGIEFIREDDFRERKTAFPRMTMEGYSQRHIKELRKYFPTLGVARLVVLDQEAPSGDLDLNDNFMNNLLNPVPNSYSFVSPERVSIGRLRGNSYRLPTPGTDVRGDSDALLFAHLIKRKQQPSSPANELRAQPLHKPWVEFQNQNPSATQILPAVLEDILEDNSCQVRFAARHQVVQESARRLGVDAFFGALPNDDPANISQKQMLNDNLGEVDEPVPGPSQPPPLVGRLFMTLAVSQANATKDMGSSRFWDQKSNSLASITYHGDVSKLPKQLLAARVLKQAAIEHPGTGDVPKTFRDIPPQHQSLMALQLARVLNANPNTRPEALEDKNRIYDVVKFPALNSRRSDEYNIQEESAAKDSNMVEIKNEQNRRELSFDPMKNWTKFPTYWINYKMLASVEYLSSFEDPISGVPNLARPQWRRLRKEDVDSIMENRGLKNQGRVLCRFNRIQGSGERLGMDKSDPFDMPVYNKYFFLGDDNSSPDGGE